MKPIVFLFFVFLPFVAFSQHVGKPYKDIKKTLKKENSKDSLVFEEHAIYCYALSGTDELDIYKFNEDEICDTAIHIGPMRALELYKQLYCTTMHRLNETTWCMDHERKRKTLQLFTYPEDDQFKFVVTEKILGFRRN